jgi:hypothetical protein
LCSWSGMQGRTMSSAIALIDGARTATGFWNTWLRRLTLFVARAAYREACKRWPEAKISLGRARACWSGAGRSGKGLRISPPPEFHRSQFGLWFGMNLGAASKEVAAPQARQQYLALLATERCKPTQTPSREGRRRPRLVAGRGHPRAPHEWSGQPVLSLTRS